MQLSKYVGLIRVQQLGCDDEKRHIRYEACSIIYLKCTGIAVIYRVRVPQRVRQLDYLTTHINLSPIRRRFALGFANYKKGCTRLATAIDKVYQILAHGQWFSPGTPASSTTKTGHHDIAEIFLKVALNKIKKSNQICDL